MSTDTRAALEYVKAEIRPAAEAYGRAVRKYDAHEMDRCFTNLAIRVAGMLEDAENAAIERAARSAPEERGEGLSPNEIAAQVVQSIADSEPDDGTIEAQEILRGTPYEAMYVLNGDVIERHVVMAVENALLNPLLASPPPPVEGPSASVCPECLGAGCASCDGSGAGRPPTNSGQISTDASASVRSSVSRIVQAVAHELEIGSASDGEPDAIAWCARMLRAIDDPAAQGAGRGEREALREIAHIIEAVDARCGASDGPVTPTLSEMRQEEISRIYELSTEGSEG